MPQFVTDADKGSAERRQEQVRHNQATIDLLNSWEQEDPDEQRETLEFLMCALDADRPSARKLFS